MFLALPIVSLPLLWVSGSLYARRRPSERSHRWRLIVVSALAPVMLLILWAVLWILPGWLLPGWQVVPSAVFLALDASLFLLSLAWFILEMLVFLLVPVYRPHA
jgi:hypothetical protein